MNALWAFLLAISVILLAVGSDMLEDRIRKIETQMEQLTLQGDGER